ncbi:hypothetical protein AGMMS50284_3110 [Clostridia bacterium]|nr:hypothetical protein AGMMS50284_3110 [Clostridia bacterium]
MVKTKEKYLSLLLAVLLAFTAFVAVGSVGMVNAGAASGDVIYFEKPSGWSGTPSVYTWGGSSGANAGFPGVAMTPVSGDIYSYVIPGDQVNIIFALGSTYQTNDYTLTGANKIFKITSAATSKNAVGAWSDYTGATSPTTVTAPTATATTAATSAPGVGSAVVALKNTANWSSPCVYIWNGSVKNAAWPGVRLSDADKDASGNYVVSVPAELIGTSSSGVIFNNNGNSQSADLTVAIGQTKIYDNGNSTWVDYDTSAVQLKVTTDVAAPQYNGTDITINAEATGGSGSFEYKFTANSAVLRGFSSNNSIVWTPTTAGTYSIVVDVKDTQGNTNTKTISYEIKDDSLAVEPVLKGITPTSGSNIQTGTPATIAVKAAGGKIGTNLLFYKVAVKTPSGVLVNTVYYKTGNTLSFTPTVEGTYSVEVSVQNSSNTTVTKTYQLVSTGSPTPSDPIISSFTTNVPSPQSANTGITLTAQGAQGSAPYTYQFRVNDAVVRDYAVSNSYVWTPAAAGTYSLSVTVKDSANKTVSESKSYVINAPASTVILGDVNLDGRVDLFDVLYLQKTLARLPGFALSNYTEDQRLNADVLHNGQIGIENVVLIQKHVAQMIVLS